jgi:serine/threonine protein kinase/Flp pilus assembly protein TadD
MIGKTISHYKILEKLGEGGMGVVYKAQDLKLDRFVALKFLPKDLTRYTNARERFIHEAKTASALQHSNICTIHEIDETEEGQIFICMDCYDGETLKTKINRGPLQIADAVNISRQIAEGLARVHSKGIIHRDIKPANIFITDDGIVKILDFGLAKLTIQTTLTKEGVTLGTIAYISPEQIRGEGVDHRTDIWSLGVVLYEMLSGDLPFKGDYYQAVFYSIMNEDPKPMGEVRGDIPEEVAGVVGKMLKKDHKERSQDALEVANELNDYLKAIGSEIALAEREKKRRKKQVKTIGFTAGIMLLLVLGFFMLKPKIMQLPWFSERKSVMIASFENLSEDPEYDYLRNIIPNLLIANLERIPSLDVLTWERNTYLVMDLLGKDIEYIDTKLASELCNKYEIGTLILGDFSVGGNRIKINVTVMNPGSTIPEQYTVQEHGLASILEHQIDDISNKILTDFKIPGRQIQQVANEPLGEVLTPSMESYKSFFQGKMEFMNGNYRAAVRSFEKALEFDSTFAAAYLYLSWAYTELKKKDPLIENLKKAYTLIENSTSKIKLYIESEVAARIDNDREKRHQILKELVKKFPKEYKATKNLAYIYFQKKAFYTAAEYYQKILEIQPKDQVTYEYLAWCYASLEDFNSALKILDQYCGLYPEKARPHNILGNLYFQMGRLDPAITKFMDSFKIDSSGYTLYWKIGYCYALKESTKKAMIWFKRYSELKLNRRSCFYANLWNGYYYAWLGNLQRSHQELTKAENIIQNRNDIYYERDLAYIKAWIYYICDRLEQGRATFKKWYQHVNKIRISGYKGYSEDYEAEYYFWLGMIDIKEGQLDTAKVKLSKIRQIIVKLKPSFQTKWKLLENIFNGEILLKENKFNKTIQICRNLPALEMPPPWFEIAPSSTLHFNLPVPKNVLARAYQGERDLIKAIDAYERLYVLNETKDRGLIPPLFRYNLAKLYEIRGRPREAKEEYKNFLKLLENADQLLPEIAEAKVKI